MAGNTKPDTDEQVVENTEEPREVARIVMPSPQAEEEQQSSVRSAMR